jgi:DNA polymerase-4
MREEGYQGRTVTVKIRFNDFRTYTRAKTLEDLTDSLEKIRKAAFECLGRVELRKKVRLVGVRISSLEKVSSSSIDTTHSTGQG